MQRETDYLLIQQRQDPGDGRKRGDCSLLWGGSHVAWTSQSYAIWISRVDAKVQGEMKAKVEELEANTTNTFESYKRFELEASLISLLNKRDTLWQKAQKMSDKHNVKIDNIIKNVTTLENSNIFLQLRLEEKESIINANLEKIQTDKVKI
jgi:hypothetical protein